MNVSKRVYTLKRATPRMKYQHMKNVMEWREDLKEKQDGYEGEGICPICGRPITSLPLWMVGVYDYCYSCFYILTSKGIRPPKRAADWGEKEIGEVMQERKMENHAETHSTLPDLRVY